jgi:hypothetical protein
MTLPTRSLLALAVVTAATALATFAVAPPAAEPLSSPQSSRVVRGAMHVHTTISDGAGTPDDVAAAASTAGLDFVIMTDHGDGTRQPAAPRFARGVLLIDAVEISTVAGHYLAFDLGPTPYPLGGEARDVIDDVARMGGLGVAAHPDSRKPELRWREWTAPFAGLEWLNADSAWRDESRESLARALAGYWWRAPETIVSLFDRPETTLARWDALSRRRRVLGVAGHDAHARIGARGRWDGAPDAAERYSLRIPSYEAAFRAFSTNLVLDGPLEAHDPGQAARVVLAALRRGSIFTVIDALAGPAELAFTATSEGQSWEQGADVPPGRDVLLEATVRPAPRDTTVVILKDGAVVTSGRATVSTRHAAADPAAAYRAEVRLDRAPGTPPVPWIVGNPIRVGFGAPAATSPPLPAATWSRALPQAGWTVEKHPSSVTELSAAVLAADNTGWTLAWQLGAGTPSGQYAAMAVPIAPGELHGADRLTFSARDDGPTRVSVQLRSHARGGARWRRSVFLSATPSDISIPLREMTPVDEPPTALDLADIDSVLFVVDTVNTAPGSRGALWVSGLRAEGRPPVASSGR